MQAQMQRSHARRVRWPALAIVTALALGAAVQATMARAGDVAARTQPPVPGPGPVPTPTPIPSPSPSPSPSPTPSPSPPPPTPSPYDAGY